MAVSTIAPNLARSLFGSQKTNAAASMGVVAGGAQTGTMMADKAQAEASRKEILKVLSAFSELEQLTGEAADAFDSDNRTQKTPNNLMERVDQAASSDAATRKQAVDKFNELKKKLKNALASLPSFSKRVNLADKSAIDGVVSDLKSLLDASNPAALKDAAVAADTAGKVYDFSKAGNADGTDLGRSAARRALSELSLTLKDGVDLLRVEAQRNDMRLSSALAGAQAAGSNVINNNEARDLGVLEKQLVSLMRRASLFQRTVGEHVQSLDKEQRSSISPETLQQFVSQSELKTSIPSAVSSFNAMRDQFVQAITNMETELDTKYAKYAVDKTRINALLAKFQQYINKDDPEYLRAAGETVAKAKEEPVFDLSAAGNASGTDLKRSEARRVLNSVYDTASELVDTLGVELTVLAARRSAKTAASMAVNGGGDTARAQAMAANYANAQRSLQTSIKTLDEVELLLGSKADLIKGDAPLQPGSGDNLQNFISQGEDATKRTRAISDFNRVRDTVIKKLGSLASIGGSVLNDSNAAQAAGDALTAFLPEGKGELRAASKDGKSSKDKVWDFSEEGLDTGLDSARSAARLTINRMIDKVREAREVYSRELLQISVQAEAAKVGAKVSTNAMNGDQSSSLAGLISSAPDPALTQSQATRRQVEANFTAMNKVVAKVGRMVGPNNADGAVASSGVSSLSDYLDQTVVDKTRTAGVRGYNTALDDAERSLSKIKKVGTTISTIDAAGLNKIQGSLSAYFDDSSSSLQLTAKLRPDRFRLLGTDPKSKSQVDVTAAGNTAGTDQKRSEARRILGDFREAASESRDRYAMEMLNQESRLIGLTAGSGAAAAKYAQNLNAYIANNSPSKYFA